MTSKKPVAKKVLAKKVGPKKPLKNHIQKKLKAKEFTMLQKGKMVNGK